MRCKFQPSGARGGYATNLLFNRERGELHWDCGREQDVIIVQTPYMLQTTDELMTRLCESLSRYEDLPDKRFIYLKIAEKYPENIAVRYVSYLENARENGCAMNGTCCTYTVFPCEIRDGVLTVFAASGNDIVSPQCDIASEAVVEVSEARRESLLGSRAIPGYYEISFPESCEDGYRDGDLVYQIRSWSIPITRRMFQQGRFYVKSDEAPRIVSRNPGVRLKKISAAKKHNSWRRKRL